MRILVIIGFAMAAAMSAAAPAAAEKVCKPYLSVIGSAAVLKGAAPKKARQAWQRAVTARYGELWNNWDNAKGADDSLNCGKAYRWLHRCEARARPCSDAPTGGDSKYPTCQALGSTASRNCDDLIVEVQTKLQAAGCSPGTIDGANGRGTRRAIRCFQRKKDLKVSGELDPKTIEALELA